MVTSKSYIEETKAFMHNTKVMKGLKKHPKKEVGSRIQHPHKIKQNIQGRLVKDCMLAKEGKCRNFIPH